MSQNSNQIEVMVIKNQQQATKLVEKLFTVAKPDAVYSQPVTANDYTVITASDVSISMGFGYGAGGGTGPVPRAHVKVGGGNIAACYPDAKASG